MSSINAILAAAGHNLRLLLAWFAAFFARVVQRLAHACARPGSLNSVHADNAKVEIDLFTADPIPIRLRPSRGSRWQLKYADPLPTTFRFIPSRSNVSCKRTSAMLFEPKLGIPERTLWSRRSNVCPNRLGSEHRFCADTPVQIHENERDHDKCIGGSASCRKPRPAS
jgi:hypothetical protein